jgi:osmoprotectant transport system substrate-binding protein
MLRRREWVVCLLLGLALVLGSLASCSKTATEKSEGAAPAAKPLEIKIGSQNYTDPQIVGEMVKLLIEKHFPGAKVTHVSGLGGSTIVFKAMRAGEVQIYPAYTGTEYTGPLGYKEYPPNREEVYNIVKKEFAEKFGFTVLKPLGFENTYVLAVRHDLADKYQLRKVSQLVPLAKDLILGTDGTFHERQADGLPALNKAYGFKWKKTVPMEYGLLYRALANKEIDVAVGYNPDSRIKAFNLVTLEDDRHFFPPYDAVLVVNSKLLQENPKLQEVLELLSGRITAQDMVNYMYKVEAEGRSVSEVAKEYLAQLGLR